MQWLACPSLGKANQKPQLEGGLWMSRAQAGELYLPSLWIGDRPALLVPLSSPEGTNLSPSYVK